MTAFISRHRPCLATRKRPRPLRYYRCRRQYWPQPSVPGRPRAGSGGDSQCRQSPSQGHGWSAHRCTRGGRTPRFSRRESVSTLHVFLAAQRPDQDVAVLVGQRLFFGQLTDFDQTGDQGMIVRELVQGPVFPADRPGCPRPRPAPVVRPASTRQRSWLPGQPTRDDLFRIGQSGHWPPSNRLTQTAFPGRGISTLLRLSPGPGRFNMACYCLNGNLTRHLTSFGSTHPV